jgi:hypothetical protein
VSTEQNPRDRLFGPDSDTADVRDRGDGQEPVEQTEDTIRDPAAHEPRVADVDQQTSDAIAEEAAAAPDDAAADRRVEDNTGNDPAEGERTGRESEATRFSDSSGDMTALSSPATSDDAIDRPGEPRGMDEGQGGEGDQREHHLDPRSVTDLAEASDMSGASGDVGADRDEDVDRTTAGGSPADGAERANIQAAPAAAGVPDAQPSDGVPGGEDTPDVENAGTVLPGAETDRLRTRWREAQLGFVDDPRQAVDDAAELVSTAVDRVASLLRDRVGALEASRSSGDADGGEADTERLRALMRRYHALLDRMLAV